MRHIQWPENKKFAFTIFDDTDFSTIQNTKPVYDLLQKLNIKTTKSCWVYNPDPNTKALNNGSSLENKDYREWLLEMQTNGFEIALHNVSSGSSKRDKIISGINDFKEIFKYDNIIFANHAGTRDSIYWASSRLSGVSKLLYKLLTRNKKDNSFVGHVLTSEYYWADYLQKHVKYIRNFTFREINTLKACPQMPYRNSKTPMANYWFASCDGGTLSSFCQALTKDKIDRLIDEQGCCIMYTHFGAGFVDSNGKIDKNFSEIMEYIASKNGWFSPVSEVLNYLQDLRDADYYITRQEHDSLSRKWLFEKVINGGTS